MRISAIHLRNYSSFLDSGRIQLDHGFNLFIGLNNSGKSALLKALSFPLQDNPHRSPSRYLRGALSLPEIEISVLTDMAEIHDRFSRSPIRPNFPAKAAMDAADSKAFIDIVNSGPPIKLTICRKARSNSSLVNSEWSSFNIPEANHSAVFVSEDSNGKYNIDSRVIEQSNLPFLIDDDNVSPIFYFGAQRLNIARYQMTEQSRLYSDASNLPAVLAYLQGAQRPVFDRIEKHVIDLMPGVKRVTVAPKGTEFEIRIWPERDSLQEELAFNLDESGTGIGQVLEIVTALVTSEQSVIVIDEINTFIHVTAVRKLISLMRADYPQHQYILSSHSADVVSACSDAKIYLVSRDGFESKVAEIGGGKIELARKVSSSLGFSMLDVFGHDRIVWVEGPTEEIAFPALLKAAGSWPGAEFGFCAVGSTDGFSAGTPRTKQVLQIYENAGRRLSPLLKGMAFALDRERMSAHDVKTYQRKYRKLRFLPKRSLENYLVHPPSITTLISRLDGRDYNQELIQSSLVKFAPEFSDPRFPFAGELDDADWVANVDAPRLLSRLFAELTDNRCVYRKTSHSPELMLLRFGTDPGGLQELLVFLKQLVEIARRDTRP